MQILKSLSLTIFLSTAVVNVSTAQSNPPQTAIAETQPKTVVIKHPAANDPATYFSMAPIFNFEIYKPGEIDKIVAEMAKDPDVMMARVGGNNGDYYMINLQLKSVKDKTWFAAFFKKVGIKMVKINNNPPVDVAKL
ncbi:hypothetical protein CNR22_17155 [Sphingobacteriaceae bacterium]|nr:hypothetical protein CNR22_17155 [Sphingobacteriaceae bacterium]